MGYWSTAYTCSSPWSTRHIPRFKCVCSAVAVALIVGTIVLLVDLAALSGPTYFPRTASLANGWEALANPRLILQELPTTSLLPNNEVAFTDAQFAETVEEQYNKIIASQKWLRQRADWEEHNLQKAPEITFDTLGSLELTVTLFSAPPAFTGNESDLNRQALLSWLHLSPRPQVVLLGNHWSLHQMAAEFPGLVTVEPNIDYSFTGLPMFHSMVARANAVTTNVTVLVPPTVILLQDFMPGLRKLAATFPSEWALVAQRLEISELPFRFVHKGGGIVFLEHSVTSESMIDRELASFVRTSGKLALLEGVNVWAWTVNSDEPLFAAPMPSFTYGAGYHDQWMARALAQSGSRIVVDATDALVGFHVRGPQNQAADVDKDVAAETSTPKQTPSTLFWNVSGLEWYNIANLYLYRKHRDIMAEEKALLGGAGWKLIGCPEPSMIKLCISETHSAANPCRCENIFSRPVSGSRYAETFLEKEARLRLEVIGIPALLGTSAIEYFHSLAQLLPQVANAGRKNVVLVGVTSSDEEMLWSFMCRARALGVTNVLVAAFDKAVYKAALVRGLPVFYAGPPAGSVSKDVQVEATKLKVQVVLQVLQQGFHVLWSDVDVLWFQNPLPRLAAYEAGMLVVESDEPDMHLPANGGGRVNAGFFYAQSDKATMRTFQDLMRYAGDFSQPEQHLFSQVLCGRGAKRRVGVTECTAPTGLRIRFLDRRTFANGLAHGYWSHPNVTKVAASNGVYVLHNNWIHGADQKVRRQKAKRLWFHNDATRMCVHPWQQPPR